jgi:hypothetical protein
MEGVSSDEVEMRLESRKSQRSVLVVREITENEMDNGLAYWCRRQKIRKGPVSTVGKQSNGKSRPAHVF